MPTARVDAHWSVRLHAAFEWVTWAAAVNLLWYAFTLAGGIALGAAPASAAAAELTRRRLRGEAFPVLRSFAAVWCREFRRANLVIGPVLAVTALLIVAAIGQFGAGALGTPLGTATLIALLLSSVLAAVLVPMYVHYELAPSAYLLTASRWMLGNPANAVLLIAIAVPIIVAGAYLPGLIPFVSLGAWITASTALCLAFFAANDRRVAERMASSSLPTTDKGVLS